MRCNYEHTVRCAFFGKKFTLEDAIGSHACSFEANMYVTNGIPLGCPLLLPVGTVNSVQTLKVNMMNQSSLQIMYIPARCSGLGCTVGLGWWGWWVLSAFTLVAGGLTQTCVQSGSMPCRCPPSYQPNARRRNTEGAGWTVLLCQVMCLVFV